LGDERDYIRGNKIVTVNGQRHLLVSLDSLEEFKRNIIQEVALEIKQKVGIQKTVEAPSIVHQCNIHRLDSKTNRRKVNNFMICPFIGANHSTQFKTFVSI
jgi:hypothetical protein